MADPRLTVTREGIAPRVATYIADNSDITYSATAAGGSAVVGRAVTLSGNGIVRLAGDAGAVLGKLLKVEDDLRCTVQTGGYMTLPKGDGAVTAGLKIVGNLTGAARGYIRNVAPATLAEVAVANGVIEDAADAANVMCLF